MVFVPRKTIVRWVYPTVVSKFNHAQTTNPENLPGRSRNMDGQPVKADLITAVGTNSNLNPPIAGEWGNVGIYGCMKEQDEAE